MSFEKLSGWGPGIRKYSATFEKRISASFDRYATNKESTVEVSSNLIPISLLETTLAAGENMHKVGFQSGSQVFPVLMSTLRAYMEQQTDTLFDRYYGFLCIRHLTRMICIGTLTEAGCFDDFMDDLEPDMTSEEVMELLAEDALDAMSDTLSLGSQLDIAELFGYLESGEKAFVIDGGLTADDVDFLINVLWEGRRWIVELTSEALLPGFPALLFVLCQMTALMNCPPSEKQWPLIQDLLLRCYLGQMADAERILIRQLGAFIDTQIRRHEIPNKYFPVDRDDALDVAYAYMDLLAPPLDLDFAPVMRLDISLILFLYTYKLTTGNGKGIVSEEIVPGIVRAGLARLQLELDVDGQAEAQEAGRGAIREYASYVFRFMGLYHERLVSRRARFAFAQVLFDEDIYGLAGRVLMLVTKETSDQPAKWDTLILNFSNLERLVGAFSSLTGPQLNLAALEWRKIVVHLLYLSTLKQSYGKYLGASFDAWYSLNPPTVEHAIDKFRCDNPRCPIQNPHMRVPESKITCAKCTSVVYCSQICQQT